jgi:group I intron endonuclease
VSKKKKGKIKVRSGIYIIINHNNNKIYVGRAVNLDKREREHFGSLENGKHFSRHLQRSFNYYEGKNFEFKILEYCEKEEIRSREAYYIYYYQSYNPLCGYNKTPGGERYVLSDEVKAKISKANKGRKHTEESRKHMSDAHKGKPNGRKGLPMTEKQRKHMEKMRACKKIISPKKGNFKYINHKEEWKILYFNQGYSIQEICIKYNVSDTAVQNILKSFDIDMDSVVRGVLKKEGVVMRKSTDLSYYKQTKYVNFVDKWIELKSQGMAYNTIAKLYSTDNNIIDGRTVQRYLENFQKV